MDGGMSDRELLGYAAIHCRTDLALFAREHVERLLSLAGRSPIVGLPGFLSVGAEAMEPLLAEARLRMYQPGPYSGTGR
jgi:hypothetical protein